MYHLSTQRRLGRSSIRPLPCASARGFRIAPLIRRSVSPKCVPCARLAAPLAQHGWPSGPGPDAAWIYLEGLSRRSISKIYPAKNHPQIHRVQNRSVHRDAAAKDSLQRVPVRAGPDRDAGETAPAESDRAHGGTHPDGGDARRPRDRPGPCPCTAENRATPTTNRLGPIRKWAPRAPTAANAGRARERAGAGVAGPVVGLDWRRRWCALRIKLLPPAPLLGRHL